MTTFFTWMFKTNMDNKPYESLNSIEYGQIEPSTPTTPTTPITGLENIQIPNHYKKQFNTINKSYNDNTACPYGCYKPYYASDIIIDANCMINRHINGTEPITDPKDIHNLLALRDRITLVLDDTQ